MPDEDALYPWYPPLLAHCKGDRTTRKRRHGVEQGGPQSVIQLAVVAAEATTSAQVSADEFPGRMENSSLEPQGRRALGRDVCAVRGTQPMVSPLFSRRWRGRRALFHMPPWRLF